MTGHKCDAIVVTCIDFRFQKYNQDWLRKNLRDKVYDLVCFAGATKKLDIIMKQIDISVKLHCIDQVILIHHEDCGAYGLKDSKERHVFDLRKAKKKIKAAYPHVKVDLCYTYLNGKFEKIK